VTESRSAPGGKPSAGRAAKTLRIHPSPWPGLLQVLRPTLARARTRKLKIEGDDGFGDIFCVPILKNLNITRKIAQ